MSTAWWLEAELAECEPADRDYEPAESKLPTGCQCFSAGEGPGRCPGPANCPLLEDD